MNHLNTAYKLGQQTAVDVFEKEARSEPNAKEQWAGALAGSVPGAGIGALVGPHLQERLMQPSLKELISKELLGKTTKPGLLQSLARHPKVGPGTAGLLTGLLGLGLGAYAGKKLIAPELRDSRYPKWTRHI